jgi:prepilin-type N-terminal cleavage/methylation domain-containing protein
MTPHAAEPAPLSAPSPGRGFTLVELLVVIAIIVVVIGILIPGLGAARNAARKVSTKALMNQISSAASSFRQDNDGQQPGYFSPAEIGRRGNIARGMSMAENILLGLSGDGAIDNSGTAGSVQAGPYPNADRSVNIFPERIGSGTGNYLQVSPEFLVPQVNEGSIVRQVGIAPHTAGAGDRQIPDLVDAFGQPLLIWVADDLVRPTRLFNDAAGNATIAGFTAVTSDSTPAVFYWAQNAAFLRARSLGERGEDQTARSLLAVPSEQQLDAPGLRTLAALLGSTGFPSSLDSADVSSSTDPKLFPTVARNNGFVVHSAGQDGVFLSRDDKQGRAQVNGTGANASVDYGATFFRPGTTSRYEEDGQRIEVDQIDSFDDIVAGG